MVRATQIPVKDFRQILTWPFVIAPEASPKTWFEDCVRRLEGEKSKWVSAGARDLMPVSVTDSGTVGLYEEAVYFHDFIRSSLYPEKDDHSTVAIYRRPSLKRIEFITTDLVDEVSVETTHTFRVELAALHVYRSGVAILTLELVHAGDAIHLDVAQRLIDRLRRAYPPFWYGKAGDGSPAFSPVRAVLVHEEGAAKAESRTDYGLTRLASREAAEWALVDGKFREPLFSWWREILAPLRVVGNAGPNEAPLLRQVLDERVPVMTTLGLEVIHTAAATLERVSDGDWYRIAGADAPGNDRFPYNEGFLKAQGPAIFYDRFMPFEGGDPDTATRFCFAGYHFAAVGAGGFFDDLVTQHVRRHYRHMQHLCLLEFATLLSISQSLCGALDDRDAGRLSSVAFRQKILDIQTRFMDFTHRYHFTGVSNQLQARELFDRFRASLELDARYAEIKAELDSASVLALSEEQRETTQAATNLTEIATVAAVVGVAAALTGMNVLFDEEAELFAALGGAEGVCAGLGFDAAIFGLTLLVTALGAMGLFWRRLSRRMRVDLAVLGGIAVALALGGAVFDRWHQTSCPPPVEVNVVDPG